MFHLLLVDDETYVVDDLEVAFPWGSCGISKVFKAYSANEALRIIHTERIDIVITDISMPRMNGLELIQSIRSAQLKIKCLLLTGYAEFDYAKEAIHQGVVEYLVKPLDHAKLHACLQSTVQSIMDEMEQAASYDHAMRAFKEHLPHLKDKLLNELIQGYRYSDEELQYKLRSYHLDVELSDELFMLIIRLEERFSRLGNSDMNLFQYAVANIVTEMLNESFTLWHCSDANHHLVFLLKPRGTHAGPELTHAARLLSGLVERIHRNVHDYLKGGISIVSTYPGRFPADISDMYDQAILALRRQAGKEHGHLLQLAERPESVNIRPLSMLYAPPTFMHLLETSQWDEFLNRLSMLRTVFNELPEQTEEHLEEVKSVLLSSFHYVAHKNHVMLSEWSSQQAIQPSDLRSFAQIQEWAESLIALIRNKLEKDVALHQEGLIQVIKGYIDSNLAMVSLQSIADHVSFHPVYVSKLFRKLCGSSISDYLLKLKMEHALSYLRDTQDKVYAISEKLGYSNSQYFIKVFKEYYGMTPQEYREKRQ